jgi:GTP-binding protein HflX
VPGRLKGLRCIHTHLNNETLSADDLTDLALLRLDLMAAILSKPDGLPQKVHIAHIMPKNMDQTPYQILPPLNPGDLDIDCLALIQALEDELARARKGYQANRDTERALLVSVSSETRSQAEESMAELRELALSGGIEVVGSVMQQRGKADSRLLIGPGKLQDLAILALQEAATIIIFDQELNPSQIRSITNHVDIKIIDRTQLILDIFAQRAQTREGKLQVELAQLKYLLPRLVVKNTAMSRLTGGIGGRGPGETKLEINRRRVRERIARLEKALLTVRQQRSQQKAKRRKKGLPVISIIGYTNAGKSTLLNTLTQSNVVAESRLFATLDPSSRRLRFPRDFEVIITDTVGFIRDLPKDLMAAFRATLDPEGVEQNRSGRPPNRLSNGNTIKGHGHIRQNQSNLDAPDTEYGNAFGRTNVECRMTNYFLECRRSNAECKLSHHEEHENHEEKTEHIDIIHSTFVIFGIRHSSGGSPWILNHTKRWLWPLLKREPVYCNRGLVTYHGFEKRRLWKL